jgi:hypothetical protein
MAIESVSGSNEKPPEEIQASFNFDLMPPVIDTPKRFRAVCLGPEEELGLPKELTEGDDGVIRDDDGSVYKKRYSGVYEISKYYPPGYLKEYKRLKGVHPDWPEGKIEHYADSHLRDLRRESKSTSSTNKDLS